MNVTTDKADFSHSMIVLATVFLNIGHPGLIFDPRNKSSDPAVVVDATGMPAETVKYEQYNSSDEVRERDSAAV
jgi:hypothetical protein